MPLFYLNIHNSFGLACDDEGVDLPDLAAAREKAIEGIRSILSEEIKAGAIDLRGRIDLVDHLGTLVDQVRFEEALRILRPTGPAGDDPGREG